jgi:hypothetical protein
MTEFISDIAAVGLFRQIQRFRQPAQRSIDDLCVRENLGNVRVEDYHIGALGIAARELPLCSTFVIVTRPHLFPGIRGFFHMLLVPSDWERAL